MRLMHRLIDSVLISHDNTGTTVFVTSCRDHQTDRST
jgi:hypothetical protein